MHMWHHVTNHLIISNDKDSNSENRIKLRVRDIVDLLRMLCQVKLHWPGIEVLPAILHMHYFGCPHFHLDLVLTLYLGP
jgi:hypothetical protein